MWNWGKTQWQDIKGNFKYDIFKMGGTYMIGLLTGTGALTFVVQLIRDASLLTIVLWSVGMIAVVGLVTHLIIRRSYSHLTPANTKDRLSELLREIESRVAALQKLGADRYNQSPKKQISINDDLLGRVAINLREGYGIAAMNLFLSEIDQVRQRGKFASSRDRRAFAAEVDRLSQKAEYLKEFLEGH